jgi:hypothetical protein
MVMAHLWVQEPDASEWHVAALEGDTHAADSGRPVPAETGAGDPTGDALLHALGGLWVLIAGEAVRVNGMPLFGGVRVLRDRDEIRVGSHRAFFSEEEPPRVVPFPGADQPVLCPRCKQPLVVGDPSVRCACGLWYHQSTDLPCFSYSDHCAHCDRPTALDAGYRWSPDAL